MKQVWCQLNRMKMYLRSALCIATLPVAIFVLVFFRQGSLYSNMNVRALRRIPFNSAAMSPGSSFQPSPSAAWQAAPAIQDYERLGIEDTDEPWWEMRDSNRTVYIAPYTGLANTLQAMASAFTISYRENVNFKFVFNREWFGPATWDDLFSYPKVNFYHTFPDGVYNIHDTKSCKDSGTLYHWKHGLELIKWTKVPSVPGEIGCLSSCCWREPPFPQSGLWFYRILRPETQLQLRIDTFKKEQNWDKYQWVGVHVRRTDNIDTMKTLLTYETQPELKGKVNDTNADTILPIEKYISTMTKVKLNFPVHKLGPYQTIKPLKYFLATDKDEIKNQILEAFPKTQVVYYEHNLPSSELRKQNWGMKLAVIDMFLLASCDVLIGTPFSTFSEAANSIGGGFYIEPNFAYIRQE